MLLSSLGVPNTTIGFRVLGFRVRGLNNNQDYFGGSSIVVVVKWAPNPVKAPILGALELWESSTSTP